MKKFTITKRSIIKKGLADWENELNGYNFNVPLCGFSDYNEPIKTGDIVSVILNSDERTKVEFEPMLYNYEYIIPHIEKVFGTYNRREEHFFKVIKPNKNNTKFKVEPVFLDKKIIVKGIDETIKKEIELDASLFDTIDRLTEILVNKPTQFNISEEYKQIYDFQVNHIISDRTTKEYPKKTMPYTNYKNTIFNIWNTEYMQHLEKIIDFCKTKYPDKLEEIGDIDKIKKNMNDLVEKYKNIEKIKFNIEFRYLKFPYLDYPKIEHYITKLKYIDIYRIYKPDFNNNLNTSSDMTNWGGTILPEKCRESVCAGNILRIKLKGDRGSGCVYFSILHKVSNKRFLANIVNRYGSKFEDVVIIIDTDCISEIPTIWEENENFERQEKEEGIGYTITGFRNGQNEKLLEITYDDLVFN